MRVLGKIPESKIRSNKIKVNVKALSTVYGPFYSSSFFCENR